MISTLDQYLAATKQKIAYRRASGTSVAGQWHTTFNLAGFPGAGSFGHLMSTADCSLVGRVVTPLIPGFPIPWSFGSGNTGYLTGFNYCNSVTGRFMLYDRIWEAGPFVMVTQRNVALTTDASLYEYRVPTTPAGAPCWCQLQIWVDVSTTLSASASTLAIGYINQSGVQKTTPATATLSGFVTGRTFPMPLAAGDAGVIRITDISIGGATNAAGVFNVYLARPLYTNAPIVLANMADTHSFEKIGMPKIDASVALGVNFAAVSTATGVIDTVIEIVNG